MSDDQLIIRGSRKKAVVLLLIAVALVAGGAFLILQGQRFGWLVACFFALGIPLAVCMLRPNATYLKLDRDGVQLARPWEPVRLKWSDVDEFYVVKIYGSKFIGIRYSASYPSTRTARKLASAITGVEGALPNHFTSPPEEVCEKLNQWRRRFGGATSACSSGKPGEAASSPSPRRSCAGRRSGGCG
jgi:hypothetical protein